MSIFHVYFVKHRYRITDSSRRTGALTYRETKKKRAVEQLNKHVEMNEQTKKIEQHILKKGIFRYKQVAGLYHEGRK